MGCLAPSKCNQSEDEVLNEINLERKSRSPVKSFDKSYDVVRCAAFGPNNVGISSIINTFVTETTF